MKFGTEGLGKETLSGELNLKLMKKIVLLFIIGILALIKPSPSLAQVYPIEELDNCRNAKECHLYCRIPKNTPACWSYGKYILQPQVLGEKTVNITYPVTELGNCKNAEECFSFCNKPDNQPACFEFAKNKGLILTEELEKAEKIDQTIMVAAKEELGCNSKAECMAFCQKEENLTRCKQFAQKHKLQVGPPEGGGNPIIAAKAQKELGCSDENSCKQICDKPENQDKCAAFAKKFGLQGKTQGPQGPMMDEKKKQEMMSVAQKELGCDSAESCSAFCSKEENREKCAALGKKFGVGPQSNTEMQKKPKPCSNEAECKAYCEKHPEECQGFKEFKQEGQAPVQLQQQNGAQMPPASLGKKDGFLPQAENKMMLQKQSEGSFLGPAGCKTEAECKAYCDKHPEECPGFPKQEQNFKPVTPPPGFSPQNYFPSSRPEFTPPPNYQFQPGQNPPAPQFQPEQNPLPPQSQQPFQPPTTQ